MRSNEAGNSTVRSSAVEVLKKNGGFPMSINDLCGPVAVLSSASPDALIGTEGWHSKVYRALIQLEDQGLVMSSREWTGKGYSRMFRLNHHQPIKTGITIAPQNPVTANDKLTWAYSAINKAIDGTDGGRKCDGPMWANLQDCRRNIREAMQMLRDERAA
jgi:hypothetical protein